MAKAVATLGVSVTARTNKFLKGMFRSRRALRQFRATARLAKKSLKLLSAAFVGLGVAAGLALRKIALTGEMFRRSMNRSLAIIEGITPKIRKTMEDVAVAVARTTQFSAREAADAYFFLASAGLDAAQSIKSLPVVARFAQAGVFDLARATDILTDAQTALGLSSKDAAINMKNMARVGNVLVRANELANASVEQFGTALTNKAAAALKDLNKPLEEGVAVLAAFASQGVKGQEAGTQFAIFLRELTNKAVEFKKEFTAAGIAVFDQFGKMRNLADIIENLEGALRGASDEQRTMTLLQLGFAQKSIVSIKRTLGMSAAIRQWEADLRSAGDAMSRVASKQLTPLEKAMARIQASFVELGRRLEPVVDAVAEGINAISRAMDKALKSFTAVDVFNKVARLLDVFQLTFELIRKEARTLARDVIVIVTDLIASIQSTRFGKKLGIELSDTLVAARTKMEIAADEQNRRVKRLERGELPLVGQQLRNLASGVAFKRQLDTLFAKGKELFETPGRLFDRFLSQLRTQLEKTTALQQDAAELAVEAAKKLKPAIIEDKRGRAGTVALGRTFVPGLGGGKKTQETFDRKGWSELIKVNQQLSRMARLGPVAVTS